MTSQVFVDLRPLVYSQCLIRVHYSWIRRIYLNIPYLFFMASGSITSNRWGQIDGGKVQTVLGSRGKVQTVLGSKITADSDCMKLKDTCSLEEKL